jgi:hypothetical protein
MRFSSAVILILVLATAAAQRPGGGTSHGGGMRPGPPSLSNGNPFTSPNGNFGPGFGSGPGGQWGHGQRRGFYPHQQRPFGNSLFFGPAIVPYPAYPPYTPDYSQWPPDQGSGLPPADVTQVPMTMSQPITNQDVQLSGSNSEPAAEPRETSTSGASGFHFYQVPVPPSSDNDDHPPLIALKNGWAYSALRYWVKGKIFHFITSLGDSMQVPVTQVERIYPSSRQGHVTDPQSSPPK